MKLKKLLALLLALALVLTSFSFAVAEEEGGVPVDIVEEETITEEAAAPAVDEAPEGEPEPEPELVDESVAEEAAEEAKDEIVLLTETVTFVCEGQDDIIIDVNRESGKLISEPADPVIEGKNFEGWFDADGNQYTAGMVVGAETYTAKLSNKVFTVTFTLGDHTKDLNVPTTRNDVVYGEKIILPETDGCAVTWYYGTGLTRIQKDEDGKYSYVVKANTDFTVVEDGYVRAYLYNGTELAETLVVAYGSKFNDGTNPGKKGAAPSEGHRFVGWVLKGTSTEWDWGTVPTTNIDLDEVWTNSYPVVYTAAVPDGLPASDMPGGQEVAVYGQLITDPNKIPTATNYTFSKWLLKDGVTELKFNETIVNDGIIDADTETIPVTAAWTPKDYTVTFDPNNDKVALPSGYEATAAVTYNTKIGTAGPLVVNTIYDGIEYGGYKFTGWATKNATTGVFTPVVLNDFTVTADVTLYAQWEYVDYAVTLNAKDAATGDALAIDLTATAPTANIPYGSTWNLPEAPVENAKADVGGVHYRFDHWVDGAGNTVAPGAILIDGAKTFTAIYKVYYVLAFVTGKDADNKDIIWKSFEVDADATDKVVDTTVVVDPEDTTEQYFFGWYTDGAFTTAYTKKNETVDHNITIYGDLRKYVTFTLDAGLGTVNGAQTAELKEPEGWTIQKAIDFFNSTALIEKAKSLGIALEIPEAVRNDPEDPDWVFVKWMGKNSTAEETLALTTEFAADKDYEAVYGRKSYTVTFDYDDADGSKIGTETITDLHYGDKVTEPKRVPEKPYQVFDGWYVATLKPTTTNNPPQYPDDYEVRADAQRYDFDTPITDNLYLKAGYVEAVASQNVPGTYLGTTFYAKLQKAFEDAQNGKNIYLLADVNENVVFNKEGVEVNYFGGTDALGNKKLTGSIEVAEGTLNIKRGIFETNSVKTTGNGKLNITKGGLVKQFIITGDVFSEDTENGLNINDGYYKYQKVADKFLPEGKKLFPVTDAGFVGYYELKPYATVTYDHNYEVDGEEVTSKGYFVKGNALTLEDLEAGVAAMRKGWHLDGWYTNKPCDPGYEFPEKIEPFDTDITVFAKWTQEITVIFMDGEKEVSKQTVLSGKTVNKPTDKPYDGEPTADKCFDTWVIAGTDEEFDFTTTDYSAYTDPLVLEAKWMVKVTFDYDDYKKDNTIVWIHSGDAVAKPEDPTKGNYTFDDWYVDGQVFDFTTKLTKNTTIKAKWLHGVWDVSKFHTTMATGGDYSRGAENQNKVITFSNFNVYWTDGESPLPGMPASSTVTLDPGYYLAWQFEAPDSIEADTKNYVVSLDGGRTWDKLSDKFDAYYDGTAGRMVVNVYEKYDIENAKRQASIHPAPGAAEGANALEHSYIFAWKEEQINPARWDTIKVVIDPWDVTFKKGTKTVFVIDDYNYKFDVTFNQGSYHAAVTPAKIEGVEYGTPITELDVPELEPAEGSEAYWTKDKIYTEGGTIYDVTDATNTITSALSLYANESKMATVTFVYGDEVQGEREILSLRVDGSDLLDKLAEKNLYSATKKLPEKAATPETIYTFKQWVLKTDATKKYEVPAKEMVVDGAIYIAEYTETPHTYTVRFVDKDLNEVFSKSGYAYNTPANKVVVPNNLPDIVEDGTTHKFLGWGEITAVTEDKTYIAQYEDITTMCEVTFLDDDGEIIEVIEYPFGTKLTADNTPKVEDYETVYAKYVFAGWEPELEPVYADAEYMATYDEIEKFVVTFVFEDGTEAAETQLVLDGETAEEPDDPQKEGEEFVGWYVGDKAFDFSTPITEDTEITAKMADNKILLDTATMNFTGVLQLRFYFVIPDVVMQKDYSVVLTREDGTSKTIALEDGIGKDGEYNYPISVPIPEAARKITVTIVDEEGNNVKFYGKSTGAEMTEVKFSVADYAESLIAGGTYKELGQALKDYAIAAHDYFLKNEPAIGGLSPDVTSGTVIAEDAKVTKGSKPEGVSGVEITANFLEDNSLNANYTLTGDVDSFTFLKDGKEEKPYKREDGRYTLKVSAIAAPNLGADHTFEVNGFEITSSVLSYAKAVFQTSNDINAKNLMVALYNYYVASKNYFNNKN